MTGQDFEFGDAQVDDLKRRFQESGAGGRVMLLPDEPMQVTPRAVWLLRVPAEGTCGEEPSVEWRAGQLRESWPEAIGVSQCALTPGHESPLHVAMLFVPTGGSDPAVCYATQVGFR